MNWRKRGEGTRKKKKNKEREYTKGNKRWDGKKDEEKPQEQLKVGEEERRQKR